MTAATDHWNATGKSALDSQGLRALEAIGTDEQTLIEQIASERGVGTQTVTDMLRGTIDHLVRLYEGDVAQLRDDLAGENGPLILQAGLADYRKTYRRLTERALTHPGQFLDTVSHLLTETTAAPSGAWRQQ